MKIINIYVSNIRTPKYIKQTLTDLNEEINSNIITVEYFKIPISIMDRPIR